MENKEKKSKSVWVDLSLFFLNIKEWLQLGITSFNLCILLTAILNPRDLLTYVQHIHILFYCIFFVCYWSCRLYACVTLQPIFTWKNMFNSNKKYIAMLIFISIQISSFACSSTSLPQLSVTCIGYHIVYTCSWHNSCDHPWLIRKCHVMA